MIKSPLLYTTMRGADPTGFGHYGAKRGTRKHKGIDLLAEPGTMVSTPIDGFITRFGIVYKTTSEFKYVEITNQIYRWRLMYCEPDKGMKLNQRINLGDEIGRVQDIASHWGGGMQNHLHIECYKHGLLTDPEPLII